MQSLDSFTDRTPLLRTDVATGDAWAQFIRHPASTAFAVVRPDGAVAGVAERSAVQRAVAEGHSGRTLLPLVLGDALSLDRRLTARQALDRLLAEPDRPDAFVVTDGETAIGVCSLRALALAQIGPGSAACFDQAVAEEFQRLFDSAETVFRAHIQGLMAMADRLARQPLGADALTQVQSIRSAGETLLRLADDTRDVVHARQGRLELEPRAESLRALMDGVQDRWSARAGEAGVSLLISYDGDPDLRAMVDAGRLAQVFDNLIDNALRYTRQGSIEAALRARVDGERIKLEGRVRDTGAAAGAARLAETHAAAAGTNPDLPLSLIRAILDCMQGDIRAQANPGQGVTMLFDLTVEAGAAPPEAIEIRPAPGAAHVLVVDDNATNRMVAEALCEMFDCTSETAEDGVEAVARVRSGRFDLILMDIKMPRMDGIAAARAIRSLEGPESMTPIVALTANVDPEDARSYLAAGMCCVVEKPIKPDRLLQAINVALTEARANAAAPGRVAAA
jgi:CheY-like chemotaxis protein